MGGDQNVALAVGLADGDELIALVQAQGPDAVGADILQGRHGQALDGAVPGDHDQEVVALFVHIHGAGMDHGLDPLVLLHGQDVHDVGALGGLAALGDLVALLAVDLAGIGEEQDVVVGGGGEHVHHAVLVPGGDALLAHAALGLGGVLADGGALDITGLSQSKDALLLLDQVLDIDLVLHVLDLGDAVVAVLVADGSQLILQHAAQHILVGQQLLEVGNLGFQIGVLLLQLLAVQTLKCFQAHIQNGLCLDLVQLEALHQIFTGVVVAGTDDVDDLVDVVLGHQQTLQQMGPLLCLAQVELGAAGDDLLLEGDILVQDEAQGQNLGLGLVVDQSQHIDGKGGLQLGLSEQTVQHHLGIGSGFQLDDDSHTVAVRLVADVGDALQTLVLHLVCHVLDEHALVDHVGDLGDHDAGAVAAKLLKLGAGADDDAAAAGGVGGPDAGAAHDDAAGGEVGALDVLHQVGQGGLGVIQHTDGGVDDLGQVVRGDVGGHADSDAGGTVDQQVGEAAGQHAGLLAGLVEVGVPVHGVLLDVPEHLIRDLGHTGLGVTVSSRGIAIHGTEVAVALHQHVAHGEVLGQTDQGVIHGLVAVGMVAAQHVADAGGGLLEGAVGGQIVLVHGVQDSAVDRLQAVTDIGQGPAHNNGHGIFNIGFLHFRNQRGVDNVLVRVTDLLRIVLRFFTHLQNSLSLSGSGHFFILPDVVICDLPDVFFCQIAVFDLPQGGVPHNGFDPGLVPGGVQGFLGGVGAVCGDVVDKTGVAGIRLLGILVGVDGPVPGVHAALVGVGVLLGAVGVDGVGPEGPAPALVVGPVDQHRAVFKKGHGRILVQLDLHFFAVGVIAQHHAPVVGHIGRDIFQDQFFLPVPVHVVDGELVLFHLVELGGKAALAPVGEHVVLQKPGQHLGIGLPRLHLGVGQIGRRCLGRRGFRGFRLRSGGGGGDQISPGNGTLFIRLSAVLLRVRFLLRAL